MRKSLRVVGFSTIVALIGIMVLATAAFAQGPNTDTNNYGQGAGNRYGGAQAGILQEYDAVIHEFVAEALNMSVADFEAAIANGETLTTLAAAQGVDVSGVWDAMQLGREAAVAQALEDGVITQDQARLLQERMGGQNGQSRGAALQNRTGDPDNCTGVPNSSGGGGSRNGRGAGRNGK